VDIDNRDKPPQADASGYCGNHFFAVTPNPPNLYFVLDRSGSMKSTVSADSQVTKYAAVRYASIDVVASLGSAVSVGAAVFPGSPSQDECSVGMQVFPTRRGDQAGSYAGKYGPVTLAFAQAIDVLSNGGTPTAATLRFLLPLLGELKGRTSVLLATDGGPNCSTAFACGAADCTWNIEGAMVSLEKCTPDRNCCDPAMPKGPGLNACLDGVATATAVAALRDAEIRTYVVGIPGSEHYASLLEQLAVLGGTARPTSPRYYQVNDGSELGATLLHIGKLASLSCEFTLNEPPPDPKFVNVYLDQTIIALDPVNGWSWTNPTSLRVNGEACTRIERGDIAQVQVVAGCPSMPPR